MSHAERKTSSEEQTPKVRDTRATDTGFDMFDRTAKNSLILLDELNEIMGRRDRHHASRALRAVLDLLRNRFAVQGAAHLSAQLPLHIREIFYEVCDPSSTPEKLREPEGTIHYIAGILQEAVNHLRPADLIGWERVGWDFGDNAGQGAP